MNTPWHVLTYPPLADISPDLRACMTPEVAAMIRDFGWTLEQEGDGATIRRALCLGKFAEIGVVVSNEIVDWWTLSLWGPILRANSLVEVRVRADNAGRGDYGCQSGIPLAYALARFGSPLEAHALAGLYLAEVTSGLSRRQYAAGACEHDHWHDHWDANETMLALFGRVFGRAPDLGAEPGCDFAVMCEATNLARRWREAGLLTDSQILDVACECEDCDVAARYLQTIVGQHDGGLAAQMLDDAAWRELEPHQRRALLADYLAAERALAEDAIDWVEPDWVEPEEVAPGTDHWVDHPDIPASDWQEEVIQGATRLGYQEYVRARREGGA